MAEGQKLGMANHDPGNFGAGVSFIPIPNSFFLSLNQPVDIGQIRAVYGEQNNLFLIHCFDKFIKCQLGIFKDLYAFA